MSTPSQNQPSPMLIFDTLIAYQKSAALKAAIDLDVFTAIAEGAHTPEEIATRADASERGIRILCDYLTVGGFLTKSNEGYTLTQDSALFLDRRSPAYAGGVAGFLLDPTITQAFTDLTTVVRTGTTQMGAEGTMEIDHPVWVAFAEGMMAMMQPAAQAMAEMAALEQERTARILDVAAGHGLFGITFLQRYPNAEVAAVDWARVLDVARRHAEQLGVADRWSALPGSAFDVDLGGDYDVILVTNFLHHFDEETNVTLLRRMRAALADGGKVITLEFVPNDDRITPPSQAAFALTMLASTAAGDAYTLREYDRMFREAGFGRSQATVLPGDAQTVIVTEK